MRPIGQTCEERQTWRQLARHDPVQHVDIPPMLLHLMGLPARPAQQGTDELDPHRSPHHAIYMVVQTPLAEQCGIQLDGYKLIYDKRLDAYALYNEIADPGERIDLLQASGNTPQPNPIGYTADCACVLGAHASGSSALR